MDFREIKCPLEWWVEHESMFAIVAFLIRQIFGIVGFQIKIENFFSLVGILTNLR